MKKLFVGIVGLASLAFTHYAVIHRPLQKYHLDGLKNELRVDEAETQEKLFPGIINGESAVSLALESFLTDSRHVESPLALAENKEVLLKHLNQPDSVIRFVSMGEEPEHGEKVEENWIIRLKIPSLSDHIFWAIVERWGIIAPYNYGFN